MTIEQYLQSLGNTSSEIANSLRAQGIKGIPGKPCTCILANAITKVFPGAVGIRIYCYGERYWATYDDPQTLDPMLPGTLTPFLVDFDAGRYPDLIATTVRDVATRVWT